MDDYTNICDEHIVADATDPSNKSDIASLVFPLFSLSTRPDHNEKSYQFGDKYVRIRPAHDGIATVNDRDILIYCMSHIMAKINRGEQVSRVIRVKASDLMAATNRVNNGASYKLLQKSLMRLQGTQIVTNVKDVGEEEIFSPIDRSTTITESTDGRCKEVEIVLSEWIMQSLLKRTAVLTLSKDYFTLRSPIQRRVYEIARKHCGKGEKWMLKIENVKNMCGSKATTKEFKRMLKKAIGDEQTILDYCFNIEGDNLEIRYIKWTKPDKTNGKADYVSLKPETYAEIKEKYANTDIDIYALENEWRELMARKGMPDHLDASFKGFVKKLKGIKYIKI